MKMRYFELAKRLTQYADHHQHHIAALVVKKNRVLGMGYNLLKTHPASPHGHKSQHAEFRAIWGLDPKELRGASIYIFRAHRDGKPARAYPCKSCLNFIKSVGIKTIYYSDYNSYAMEQV